MANENPTPAANPAVEAPSNTQQVVENQEVTTQPEVKESKKESAKSEKEIKKALKQLQLKIDGKEVIEELPFELPNDEEARKYLTRELQLAKMAHQRANQFSTLDKEVRSFINELRSNPEKVLSDPAFGIDLKEFASKIIEKEIENSKKSPEQIEKEKLQEELRKVREDREKEKQELQQRAQELLDQQEYDRYDREVTEALETSDLPKSPYVVKKMADYMLAALEKEIDLSPKDVLPLVREEIMKDIKDMFGVMPEEVIEAIIGKDTIGKLRKRNAARAKEAPPVPVQKAVTDIGKTTEPKKEPVKKMNYREFFRK